MPAGQEHRMPSPGAMVQLWLQPPLSIVQRSKTNTGEKEKEVGGIERVFVSN